MGLRHELISAGAVPPEYAQPVDIDALALFEALPHQLRHVLAGGRLTGHACLPRLLPCRSGISTSLPD